MSEVRGPRSEARGPDDRIDLAIDRAVREMLDVEPRADLRARVIRRIERPITFTDRVASSFSWKILVPVAAMALIVLAVFLARRSEPLPEAPVVASATDRHLPAEPTLRGTKGPVAEIAVARAVRRQAAHTQASRTVAAAAVDENGTTVITPLKTITPIAVAAITQDSIAPADIAVRPLNAITEVQIAPLTPPDRRN